MSSEKLCSYLGYIAAVFFFLYVTKNILTLNTRIIEGLASGSEEKPRDRLKEAREEGRKLGKSLGITENRGAYQDTVAEAQDHANLAILAIINKSKNGIPEGDDMEQITRLQHFKAAAGDVDEFLDKYRE
jgi:hypothetical protein